MNSFVFILLHRFLFFMFFINRLFAMARAQFRHKTIIHMLYKIQNKRANARHSLNFPLSDWMCFIWLRIVDCGYIKREQSVLRIFDDLLPCTHSYMYLHLPLRLMDDLSIIVLFTFFSFILFAPRFLSGFWLLMFQHQSYLFNGFCANKHILLYHVSRLNNERTKKIMIEIIAYGVFDGRFLLTKCQHMYKRIENWFWFYSQFSSSARILPHHSTLFCRSAYHLTFSYFAFYMFNSFFFFNL